MRDVKDDMAYKNIDYGKIGNEIRRDVKSSHMTVVCTSFVFAEFRLIFAQFFLALF